MNTFLILFAAVLLACLFLMCIRRFVRASRSARPRVFHLCNLGVETHSEEGKGYFADAAVTTRYLLATLGTDADHAAICGAGDIPLGPFTDEVATADIAAIPINVQFLGLANRTLPMIASETITAGEEVYTAAAGQVQDLPTGAGTYYSVGFAVTAGVANTLMEVRHHSPRKLILT